MKIISIGTDRKLFEEGSSVRQRMIEYAKFFEEIHIVVFTTRSMNYESRFKLSENIFVYPTDSRNRFFYISDAFRVSKRVIHNSKFIIPDSVVTCQDPFETGLVGVLIKMFFDIPLHIQIHTDLMNPYFRQLSALNRLRFLMAEFVLKCSDRARVVSERIKKSIEKFSKNIDVLPILTGIKEMDAQGVEAVKKPFPFTLLMACRIEKEKNIKVFLEAIKKLKEKSIGLCIVGDGSQKIELQKTAKDLGIDDRVVFAGWKDALATYYKMADVFASSSLYEGHAVSIVEAAYFGKPLIISETGAAGELFKNKESAFVCDAKNSDCFAQSILSLYKNKDMAQEMGIKAKMAADSHLGSGGDYFSEYAMSVIKTGREFVRRSFMRRVCYLFRAAFDSFIMLRYFLCGLTGAAVNLSLLYVFTDVAGVWYLVSSVLAFVISLALSLILQKFIVFRDKGTNGAHLQFMKFFVAAVLGVVTNTAVVFVCVEGLRIWYILAQIIGGFFVMFQNFLLYRFFIFKK